MRLSGSNPNRLTQLLMFLVVDSVLYVANIETEIEWVQSPKVVSITDRPLTTQCQYQYLPHRVHYLPPKISVDECVNGD